VKARRSLLLIVVLYIGLDFSLPDMPGAFVFDPAGSVESIGLARPRPAEKITALPIPIGGAFLRFDLQRSDLRHRRPLRSEVVRPEAIMVNYLPRAICAPPRPPEDPH
jgi:hypothetical protein